VGLVEASEGEMAKGWRYGMEKARVRRSKPEAMENIYDENGKRKESRGIEGNKRGNDKVGRTKLKVDGRDPISMENGIIVASTTPDNEVESCNVTTSAGKWKGFERS